MQIGFHLSVAKGFDWTLAEARRLGCEVVQIFVKNPRGWQERAYTDAQRESFARLRAAVPVYAHLSYLPNPARIDENSRNLEGMLHEASLCAELGIEWLIIHCGSREDTKRGMATVARAVNEVLERHDLTIVLENAAGQGNALGRTIDELGRIYEGIERQDRVLVCIDTAHIFEAGYDVRKRATWRRIVREVDRHLGPGKIGFFHFNDSKTDLGSAVDRHWHIGQGKIGLDTFRYLMNEERFAHLRGVMETPKMGGMDDKNMEVMRSLSSLVPRPPS